MTDKKLTDSEIVKAFDCCYTDRYPDCTECPRYNREKEGCMDVGSGNIYDLPKAIIGLSNRQQETINRLKAENKNSGVKIQNQREQLKACNEKIKEQQAEIERLKNSGIRANSVEDWLKHCNELRAEAVKEFAERVKALLPYDGMSPEGRFKFGRIKSLDIDNLLKEKGCGE